MTGDATSLESAGPVPGNIPAAASRMHQSVARTAAAGLIGNVLEWFDFAVYGYFASVIGSQFFPQSSPSAREMTRSCTSDVPSPISRIFESR